MGFGRWFRRGVVPLEPCSSSFPPLWDSAAVPTPLTPPETAWWEREAIFGELPASVLSFTLIGRD